MGACCATHDMVLFKAGVLSLIWDRILRFTLPFFLRKRAVKCVFCGAESIHVTLEICILTVHECYITSWIPKTYYINFLCTCLCCETEKKFPRMACVCTRNFYICEYPPTLFISPATYKCRCPYATRDLAVNLSLVLKRARHPPPTNTEYDIGLNYKPCLKTSAKLVFPI